MGTEGGEEEGPAPATEGVPAPAGPCDLVDTDHVVGQGNVAAERCRAPDTGGTSLSPGRRQLSR